MSAPDAPRLGDLLDAGFRVYRRHFLPLVALAAITSLPAAIGANLLSQRLFALVFSGSGSLLANSVLIWALNLATSLVLALLLGVLQQGMLAAAIVPALGGERVNTGAALRAGLRSYPALVLAGIVPVALERLIASSASTLLSPLTLLAYGVQAAVSNPFWLCTGVLLLPFAVAASALYGQLALYVPAIVFERRGPYAALLRSWELTGGARAQAMLLVLLGKGLLYAVAVLPWSLLSFAILRLNLGVTVLGVAGIVSTFAGQVLVAPLSSAFFAALYVARRAPSPADALERDVATWAGLQ